MDEEDNPFKIDRPNIVPLVPDLNSSILSAEREKSNIISNPWETSDGEDILKSINDIKKNNKRKKKKKCLIYIQIIIKNYKIMKFIVNSEVTILFFIFNIFITINKIMEILIYY